MEISKQWRVELGGHMRVGLEDAPWQSTASNVELVAKAVAAVQKAGGEPATAAEVRADLAAYRRPEAQAA
jgi:uncharacterized protein (DUF849 family)